MSLIVVRLGGRHKAQLGCATFNVCRPETVAWLVGPLGHEWRPLSAGTPHCTARVAPLAGGRSAAILRAGGAGGTTSEAHVQLEARGASQGEKRAAENNIQCLRLHLTRKRWRQMSGSCGPDERAERSAAR